MKSEFYTQCRLVSGSVFQVAFIPAKLAIKGQALRLAGEPSEWIGAETYETVPYHENANLQHNAAHIWEATAGPDIIGHK